MKDGSVLLTALKQADGTIKDRPVILPAHAAVSGLPDLRDQYPASACGFWLDELITPADADFRTSGLKSASVIRLGFLAVQPAADFKGRIGSISSARVKRLLTKLSDFLRPK